MANLCLNNISLNSGLIRIFRAVKKYSAPLNSFPMECFFLSAALSFR